MVDYYVDNSVPGPGSGTIGDPWDDIASNINGLVAGDTMHVRGDVGVNRVYNENINITTDGAVGNVITLRNFAGEDVELRSSSGDILDISGDYIVVNGFDINGEDALKYAIDIISGADNVVIQNCEIFDIGGFAAIRVDLGTNITIDTCIIHDCFRTVSTDSHGILIMRDGPVRVIDCIIYDCAGDGIQVEDSYVVTGDITVEGCTFYTSPGKAGCTENAIDVKEGNTIIRDCTCYGFWYCDATCGGSGSQLGAAIIAHNSANTILIDECTIYDCTSGVKFEEGVTATMQRTVVRDLHTAAADPGSSFHTAVRTKSSTTVVYLYNNTFDDCPEDSLNLNDGTITLKNNIFNDCGTITEANSPAKTYDHNCWFNCTDTIVGVGDVTADPLFVNEAANDFHLQAGSPCIDAGVNIGLPYQGSAPDMGAFERSTGSQPRLVHVTTILTVTRLATATRVGVCD